MIKPDMTGRKQFYINPTIDTFTAAQLANIASAMGVTAASIQPFAYTGTVSSQYDAHNFSTDTLGTGCALADGKRIAFGLFLTPQSDLGNVLFQLSANLDLTAWCANAWYVRPKFFFGRVASTNTVTSSKASANNALDKFSLIAPNAGSISFAHPTTDFIGVNYGVETEIFSILDTTATQYNYVFGCMIENNTGVSATIAFQLSLAFRKYGDVLSVYRPTG